MAALRTVAASGDLPALQHAYLDFCRSQKKPIAPVGPGLATDPAGELICAHIIRNNTYGTLPPEGSMGADWDWTFNPTPRDDPAFTDEWTWCVVSRMEFWMRLADAYSRTRNEKYAREWVAELRDFAAKNRLNDDGRHGRVTLWRTLDSAKRMAVSWPYAYRRFLASPALTPDANWLYLKLVCDHAACLTAGLNNESRSGNWVTSECQALYTIGVLFPELREAARWRDVAVSRMVKEMERMVLPDGMEAELAPGYHVVALNSFRGMVQLATEHHYVLPATFIVKIRDMYKALVMIMDQSGAVVPTNDSAGFVDATQQAQRGLELMSDPVLSWASQAQRSGAGLPNSTRLPFAGFYALRGGWKPDDLFLFFRAGPTGLAHEHEDMLQIVLRAGGRTLLLEPGIYSYDHSDWRRYALGTASHNTIIVDGKWQHRGPSAISTLQPVNNPWVTTPVFDYVAGIYDGGYQTCDYDPTKQSRPMRWVGPVDRSVVHTRHVLYLRPAYVVVLDSLDGSGTHTFDAHFHLEAPAAAVIGPDQAVFSQHGTGMELGLYPLEHEHLVVDVVQGQKDPLLGWLPAEHRPIPTVRFRKVQAAPATFATLLYPFDGNAPVVHANAIPCKTRGVWSERLTTPLEIAEITLSTDCSARSLDYDSAIRGPVTAHAAGVVVRQPKLGDEISGGWFLTVYCDEHIAYTTTSPAALLIAEHAGRLTAFNGGAQPVVISFTRPFTQSAVLASGVWTAITPSGSVQRGASR